MSRRMSSVTTIFDTEWLTEADFGEEVELIVSIDYQAYDTLKIIIQPPAYVLAEGGFFQEIDVYKLENFGTDYQLFLEEFNGDFIIEYEKDEGYSTFIFVLNKNYWKTNLEGIGSIYIKGVKR